MNSNKKYIRPRCPHNKFKSRCIECNGGSICEHLKLKIYCKLCGGKAICEHNKIKYSCKDCKGSAICEHNKRKRLCKDCNGSGICIHDKRYDACNICNIHNYIIKNQRDALRRIMTNKDIIKNKKSIEYLGCDVEKFYNFIKSKMTSEMDFTNIHYDHIKPVSAFNFEDENEILKCCHYTNFQPLLIKDNLYKSNKWSAIDEEYWINNIIYNENFNLIYMPNFN
jgi:hypothetical protein